MTHEHNPTINSGAIKYFSNCRGVNYLPPMEREWAKSGYLPRYSQDGVVAAGLTYGHDASNVFIGSNKTTQWWYYSSEDNDASLKSLASVGINAVRVFLDIYVWLRDSETFLNNLKDFLNLCGKHKVRCQFVIWDGIDLPDGSYSPGDRTTALSSALETGLGRSWLPQPLPFEVSSSAQAADFFEVSASVYLDDLAQTVSAHQAMWSFDIKNEFDGDVAKELAVSSYLHLKPLVSSVGITMTVGNGAGYDPQLAASGDPNIFYQMSSTLDFASIHSYNNCRYFLTRLIREAASGAAEIDMPGMYNESTSIVALSHPSDEINMMGAESFGGMMFDGFADRSASHEPFLDSQGMIFGDGTWRNANDALQYANLANSTGWFSPNQLTTRVVEKGISEDDGLDGGYCSGTAETINLPIFGDTVIYTPPEQKEWKESYSAVNEDQYLDSKKLYYGIYTVLSLTPSAAHNPNMSRNFPMYRGDTMAQSTSFNWGASGLHLSSVVAMVQDSSSTWQPLSSYTSDDFHARNLQVLQMNEAVRVIMYTTFESSLNAQLRPEFLGTEYDYSPVASSLRTSLSSTYYTLSRGDGLSINPSIDNIYYSTGTELDLACHATSSCYYVGDTSANGIDWEAYDVYYNGLFDEVRTCVSALDTAAESNSDFRMT